MFDNVNKPEEVAANRAEKRPRNVRLGGRAQQGVAS